LAGATASPELVAAVQAAVRTPTSRLMAQRLDAVLTLDDVGVLERIKQPILCLRGTQDRLVPASAAELVARVGRDVVREDIPGPHLLLQTSPERCWQAIERFRAARL